MSEKHEGGWGQRVVKMEMAAVADTLPLSWTPLGSLFCYQPCSLRLQATSGTSKNSPFPEATTSKEPQSGEDLASNLPSCPLQTRKSYLWGYGVVKRS